VIDVPATIAAKGELASITGQIRDISRLIEVTIAGQALYDAIKRPVVLNADQTPQYSDIRAPAMTAATSCSCAGVKGYPVGYPRPR
jgi:hypothetical protein